MLNKIEGAKKLQPGEMKEFKVNQISILLIHYQEKFYAISNKCTHLGCKLSKGTLKEDILTCLCHSSKFDITNGKLVGWISRWPRFISSLTKTLGLARPLVAYQIVEKANDLYIVSITTFIKQFLPYLL